MDTEKTQFINEMVSVIMPAYNSEKYIFDAVKSVMRQTYENWELIIQDDFSTDGTVKNAEKAAGKDQRISIAESKKNSGVAMARNTAIEKARGRYIAFLDSDDLWEAQKLEKQLEFMKQNTCALSYSSYKFINEDGLSKNNRNARIIMEAGYTALLKNNFIGMLTVVIDRQKTGAVIFSGERHEDLILWFDYAKRHLQMRGIDEPLALYRISGKSLSGNKLKAAVWRWRIYRKTEKLNLLRSMYYMAFYIVNSILKRIAS